MQKAVLKSKGMFTQNRIAGLALVIVIGIVLLKFSAGWKLLADDTSITERCRLSVERNARFNVAGINGLGTKIDCPTRELKLKDETEDEAKEKLAYSMYSCWKQFGQGKSRLFSENGVYCNICYIVDLQTKDDIKGFTDYLMTTPSPSENLYYYDYLSSFSTSKAKDVLGNSDVSKLGLNEEVIKTGNKYAVIFVYARGDEKFLKIFSQKMADQLLAKSDAGKVVTGVAAVSAVGAGAGAAAATIAITMTAPVSVPVIVVVGIGVGTAVVVYSGVQWVGSWFNPDDPPQWLAFNVLREWNPLTTPDVLVNELGCKNFVETESN